MIKMQLIGYIGRDAIVNESPAGSVANFSVCHTDKWKAQDVIKERQIWVSCSLWDREALHPYLKKGVKVYVEGTPEAGSYVDRDGKTVLHLKLRVFNIELCSKPNTTSGQVPEATTTESTSGYSGDDVTDDLPF